MNKRKSQSRTSSVATLYRRRCRQKKGDGERTRLNIKTGCGQSNQDSDGGCLHYAMNKMIPGVVTVDELDNQIDQLHRELPNLTRDQCGIEGETWHINCIPKALFAKYGKGNFLFRRLHPNEFENVLFTPGNGKYLVTGTLNHKLFPDSSPEGNWQHAICVSTDTNEIYCNNNPQPLDLSVWLPKSVSQGYEGYMNPISRVYQLTVSDEQPIGPLD